MVPNTSRLTDNAADSVRCDRIPSRFRRVPGKALLIAGYLLLFAVLTGLLIVFSREQLQQFLFRWQVVNLWVNLFSLATVLVFCRDDLRSLAGRLRGRSFLAPALLLVVVLVLVTMVVPRGHRIYFDEDIYANVGQNIALDGRAGYTNYGSFEYDEYSAHRLAYNKEPGGWPFVLALFFKLFGVDERLAFYANHLFYLGAVFLLFCIAWHMARGCVAAGAFAALVYAFSPHALIWSGTGAAEPAAVFFALLAVWLALVAVVTGRNRHLLLLALTVPLAAQMRMESGIVVVLAVGVLLLFRPGLLRRPAAWWAGLAAGVLLLPVLIHLYAVSGHSWGAEEIATFSLFHLSANLAVNGPYFFLNREFPLAFTIAAVAGLLVGRHDGRWRLFCGGWFLFFWGIFLFFYAGSYHYGADNRFAILSMPPLALLAGMGACRIISWFTAAGVVSRGTTTLLLLVLLAGSAAGFLPMVRLTGQEGWGSRYDHLHALRFMRKIPKRSLVLTHNPSVFLLHGYSAVQTRAGLDAPSLILKNRQRYNGHVYFYYNYWCNTRSQRNITLCSAIRDKYILTPVASAKEQDFDYVLYRIDGINFLTRDP